MESTERFLSLRVQGLKRHLQNLIYNVQKAFQINNMLKHKRFLRVFLCHASADKPVVRALYERLSSEGWIDPWLDEEKLTLGQHWTSVIEGVLDKADIVIVFLSKKSVQKEGFVQRELNYAWELSLEKPRDVIFLIPFRLDDCSVPRHLRSRQWGDYFGEKKDSTYKSLIRSLKERHKQVIERESKEGISRLYSRPLSDLEAITIDAITVTPMAPIINKSHKTQNEKITVVGQPLKSSLLDGGAIDFSDAYYSQTDNVTLLEELIFRQCQNYIAKGYSIDLLKRGVNKAMEIVVGELRKMAIRVEMKEDINSVASYAAEDEKIGCFIADVIDKLGRDGLM